ncbi:hypothetical protein [Streptomyces sp. NPDC047974]|uniref:hypothetical protein n=1 Tax=Streptomyces sp. NPDC047974 TaxID=3154343 RepID=UPI0033C9833F
MPLHLRQALRVPAHQLVTPLILAARNNLPADQRPAVPDMDAVPLEMVQALGVSHAVAGQRRQAADLIATGYTG